MCVGVGRNVWVKEMEDDTNKQEHMPCSLTGKINNVNMFIIPKAIYRCDEIPIQIPMTLFKEIEDSSKTHMISQKTPNTQSNLEKESCSLHTPIFQARIQNYDYQNSMVLA